MVVWWVVGCVSIGGVGGVEVVVWVSMTPPSWEVSDAHHVIFDNVVKK